MFRWHYMTYNVLFIKYPYPFHRGCLGLNPQSLWKFRFCSFLYNFWLLRTPILLEFPIMVLRVGMDIFWSHTMWLMANQRHGIWSRNWWWFNSKIGFKHSKVNFNITQTSQGRKEIYHTMVFKKIHLLSGTIPHFVYDIVLISNLILHFPSMIN